MATVKHIRKHSMSEQEMKKESKTVTFYKNGDVFFSGHVVTITPRRYRSFEVLLSELSRITSLPQGVRYLLDRDNGTKVEDIEHLKDGKAYVCASNAKLKRLDYGRKGALPQWGSKHRIELPAIANPPRVHANSDSSSHSPVSRHKYANTNYHRVETKERRIDPSKPNTDKTTLQPRNVMVIRNGRKPRIMARVLLNKRTAQTLDQVLDQVNDSLGVSGASNVRKLFNVKGKHISEVSELFFDEDGVFIAVGSERFRPDEIESIIDDETKNSTTQRRAINKVGHHAKSGNDGMFKYSITENKQVKEQLQEVNYVEKSPRYSGEHILPKIQDSNNNNTREARHANRLPRSPAPKKPQSPKHRITLGKQTQNTARVSHIKKKTEASSSTVKLPQIGNGNLVSKQNATGEPESDGRKSKGEVITQADHVSPRAGENQAPSKAGKPAAEKKQKSSKESSGSALEEEVEFSRVTNKRVDEVYAIGRKIGDGNFAVVRQCANKITKKEFALKIVDKRKIQGKEKMIDDEIAIMRRCRHPNIVRLYEDYDTATEIYLVMEFIRGGDLFDAISSSVKFSEHVAQSYFRDMCKALAYLHKRRIVHRDLKPENLLVHKRPNRQTILKLADFGLAMEVMVPVFTVCGTPTYVAPEILDETGYGLKVDMWAAGVITYIMLCGFPPFRSPIRDQDELFDLIQAGEFEFLSPYWDPVSDEAKDLISLLLVAEPNKRFSAEQALLHSWTRHKSPKVTNLSTELLEGGKTAVKGKKKFKAVALAVQGAKKFENLVAEFHPQRGEKFIST